MPKAKRILAIDPGEKAGWASVHLKDGVEWEDQPWQHGIKDLRDAGLFVYEHARDFDAVVYETWRLRPPANVFIGSDFPSIQLIGMIRMSCWIAGTRLVPQSPVKKATANKTADLNPYLADLIAREPGRHDEAHNIDAMRHLWYYCWTEYVRPNLVSS